MKPTAHQAVAGAHDLDGERGRLARRLRRVIRGQVLFDAASRGRYASDGSLREVEPLGVVVPADEADLAATLALAGELGVPVLSRGAGSSRGGHALGASLVIDHSRHLNRLIAFDPRDRLAEVQPGIVLDRLNAQLAPSGLWFPVDVASSAQATLGGMAANGACGLRAPAYGGMVHHVHGIDALLADGTDEHFGPFGRSAARPLRSARTGALVSRLFEIAGRARDEIERAWPRVLRRAGGYNLDVFHPVGPRPYGTGGGINLAHLLVGSEGSLAVFRRLHLRLAPRPAHRVTAVCHFPSVQGAVAALPGLLRLGPCAAELLDAGMLESLRRDPMHRAAAELLLASRSRALLLVEFAGDERAPLLRQRRLLDELAADLGLPGSVAEAVEPGLQARLWGLHRAALAAAQAGTGTLRPASVIDNCTLPVEQLGDYVEAMDAEMLRHGLEGAWYGHAGIGSLQWLPKAAPGGRLAAAMPALAEAAFLLVRRLRGSFAGGYGEDGPSRAAWIAREYGPRLSAAFAEVKALFDPQGRLPPGPVERAPGWQDPRPLRVLAPPGLPVALDWAGGTRAGDLGRAVTACDGGGSCRGLDAGVMCPSFRVTREERDSPRGRANTLRLALAGRFGPDGAGSDEVAEAMASCVSCKACRRECPAGVDIARMKIEARHSRFRLRGLSRGERLLASLPAWAPRAARLAPLLNLRDRIPGLAALSGRLLGLAPRPLPRWRGDTFLRSRPVPLAEPPGEGPEVLLFADCFHNHFEPDTLHAAAAVLGRAGCRIGPALPAPGDPEPRRPLCCGRSYLATGLVDEARAEARRTAAALVPALERGAFVVGLEPACLLTMRDEFRALGLGEAAARLSDEALLFEEFLVRQQAAARGRLALSAVPWTRALLHGHCHQHAFDAMAPVRQVLSWVPGLELLAAPAGCCGMGDGAGYRADHHTMSMRMAELGLLPAARTAQPSTVIVADGFGCRRQVADGAGREALHVARVLEAALPSSRILPLPARSG